jgi:hypothetical protein
MVDFVRLALSRNPIDSLLNHKGGLYPPLGGKSPPQALCAFGLAASAGNDLLDRNGSGKQRILQLRQGLWKIDAEDRLRVRQEFDLKASGFERIEHNFNASGSEASLAILYNQSASAATSRRSTAEL